MPVIKSKREFEVALDVLPKCHWHPDKVARYDFATRYDGVWAYGCFRCYMEYRLHPTLGVGKGQRLVVPEAGW